MVIIRVLQVIMFISIFFMGWYAHDTFASDAFKDLITEGQDVQISVQSTEKAYPSDWVQADKIKVYDEGVVLDIQGAEWARFTDTHSMEPTLGERSNAIQLIPKDPAQIKEGDIISYKSKIAQGSIIHRVNYTAEDELGWYAVTKGDNNSSVDPERVRFEQVERIVVAIVY